MVDYKQQPLDLSFINEFNAMLARYYQHTVASDGIPPYDFEWPFYLDAETAGFMRLYVAREAEKMVGAALYTVATMPHHRSFKLAECDSISVDMDYRGLSIGRTLYQFAESNLIAEGVDYITHRSRLVYDTKPMFESLGFDKIETVFMKKVR